jgi:integrase
MPCKRPKKKPFGVPLKFSFSIVIGRTLLCAHVCGWQGEMDQFEDQTPNGCEESDEGSRGCSREAADDGQRLGGRWAANLWRGHHDLQKATPRGRDPTEHKGVSRGRFELVLRSWENVETLNIRRITSKMVEEWLRRFKATAQPYVPRGAKTPAMNSTGASMTTIKCALDAVRQVLDVAVSGGHLYANPARNTSVTNAAKRMFKVTRRERAERGALRLPTREEFVQLVDKIRTAGVLDCKAAADHIQFIAFSGARKTGAANVTWTDIDFNRETIHLRVTKNGESRYVPMTGEMRQLLEQMKAQRENVAPKIALC